MGYIVHMVSSFHMPDDSIVWIGKKPRVNQTNKQHIESVWGGITGKQSEFLGYYKQLQALDEWTRLTNSLQTTATLWDASAYGCLLFHALYLVRINSYIIHKKLSKDNNKLDQKEFVLGMWLRLLERSMACCCSLATWSSHEKPAPTTRASKRKWFSHTAPTLPQERFKGSRENHCPAISKKRSNCKYCSFLVLKHTSEEDFTLVVSLNEYILRGDAVGTTCTYVDLCIWACNYAYLRSLPRHIYTWRIYVASTSEGAFLWVME
jgi:hypothetical protein